MKYTQGVEVKDMYYVYDDDNEMVGMVARLPDPYSAYGSTYRWRAYYGGMWIDIARRKDFESVYTNWSNRA